MKKILAFCLTIVMLLSLSVVTFADEGTIAIANMTAQYELNDDFPITNAYDGDPSTFFSGATWGGDMDWKVVTKPYEITLAEPADLTSLVITWAVNENGTNIDRDNNKDVENLIEYYRCNNYGIVVSTSSSGEDFQVVDGAWIRGDAVDWDHVPPEVGSRVTRPENSRVETIDLTGCNSIRRIRIQIPEGATLTTHMGNRHTFAEIVVHGTPAANPVEDGAEQVASSEAPVESEAPAESEATVSSVTSETPAVSSEEAPASSNTEPAPASNDWIVWAIVGVAVVAVVVVVIVASKKKKN